mmetsp:Transcript_23426/g.40299  ORF Transcript_23426/g.40299 Transcript_23426/m.40299 type:complete len:147 (-) Transcript_23426:12-452(-)
MEPIAPSLLRRRLLLTLVVHLELFWTCAESSSFCACPASSFRQPGAVLRWALRPSASSPRLRRVSAGFLAAGERAMASSILGLAIVLCAAVCNQPAAASFVALSEICSRLYLRRLSSPVDPADPASTTLVEIGPRKRSTAAQLHGG